MGNKQGTRSKSTSEIFNEIAVSATAEIVNRCVQTATQQQLIRVRATNGAVIRMGDISQSQGMSVNMSCFLQSKNQMDLQNKIATEIAQAATASGKSVTSALGRTGTEIATAIRNKFQSTVNLSTLNEAVQSYLQSQSLFLDASAATIVIGNVTQTQSAQIIAKATIEGTSYGTVLNDLANQVDQKASSKETGITDTVGNIAKGISSTLLWIALAVVAVIGIVLFVFVYNSSDKIVETTGMVASTAIAARSGRMPPPSP